MCLWKNAWVNTPGVADGWQYSDLRRRVNPDPKVSRTLIITPLPLRDGLYKQSCSHKAVAAWHTLWYVRNAAAPGSCPRSLRRAGRADVSRPKRFKEMRSRNVHPVREEQLGRAHPKPYRRSLDTFSDRVITMLSLARIISLPSEEATSVNRR